PARERGPRPRHRGAHTLPRAPRAALEDPDRERGDRRAGPAGVLDGGQADPHAGGARGPDPPEPRRGGARLEGAGHRPAAAPLLAVRRRPHEQIVAVPEPLEEPVVVALGEPLAFGLGGRVVTPVSCLWA